MQSYGMLALEEPTSDGALRLVQALEESEEPLYVGVWGGSNTLAQALQHIQNVKQPDEALLLQSRLRVYAISDQDSTGPWIRRNWPNIVYIVTVHGFREYIVGAWLGISSSNNGAANLTKVLEPWLSTHIRIGPMADAYAVTQYSMEGDTPSFLWLLQNGLSNPERPDWGGWCGRYSRIVDTENVNEYGISADTLISLRGERHYSVQAPVWRWQDAYQDDFAARMLWTVTKDFSQTVHPPVIKVNGDDSLDALHMNVPTNESITLDASETYDQDHPGHTDELKFEWFVYLEAGTPRNTGQRVDFFEITPMSPPSGGSGILTVNEAGFQQVATGEKVQIQHSISKDKPLFNQDWHVILQVRTKKGPHPIRRYKRIIVHPM